MFFPSSFFCVLMPRLLSSHAKIVYPAMKCVVKSKQHSPSSSRPSMYLSNLMHSYSIIPFIFQVSSILSIIYIPDIENSDFAHIFLFFFFCIKYFSYLLWVKSQCKDLSRRKWMLLLIMKQSHLFPHPQFKKVSSTFLSYLRFS